jgi:hypothetical protein
MGANKNSSRRRLKLRQDELTRSSPQNHTLRTSTFRLPKPRSHWSATGPRNKNLLATSTHTHPRQRKQLESQLSRGGRLDWVCGAVRPPPPGNQEILRNTSSEHQKRTTVSPTDISGQGHASYQKILAKTKTPPRGLGAVRPATRGGLTSCTQQQTPTKNT